MAKAKTLLAEAGYPPGLTVTTWIWQLPGITVESPQVMEAIAVWWEQIGFKVPHSPYDVTQTLVAMRQGFKSPTLSGIWFGALQNHQSGLRTGVSYKDLVGTSFVDDDVERYAHQIYEAKTIQEYITAAQGYQDALREKYIQIPLFFAGDVYAIKKGLGADKWNLGRGWYDANLAGLFTDSAKVR